MKNLTKVKTIGLSLATVLALGFSGCGSSSSNNTDNGDNTTSVKTGEFLDAKVQGIKYTTDSQSGFTDTNGSFKYKDGETVTFEIGGIKLGSTKAIETITPQEIVGVTVVENSKAQDMLILLQTLDADHNPSNGIEINEATRVASASMNVDFIEDTIDIDSIITQFGIDESYKVSDTNAMAHFQETLKAKYPSKGLKFTKDTVKNKSFYKIFVKEDKTTVIYVKVTFNENDVTFTYGTKDEFINGGTGSNTGNYSINSNGTLINGDDVWELLKLENDKMIILNTITTDDDGNTIPERKAVEKWLINKPAGFP